MTKRGYINFLKGVNEVDLVVQVRCIEDYIYAMKGISVKINNPNSIRGGRALFLHEASLIVHAFTHICERVMKGEYVPTD